MRDAGSETIVMAGFEGETDPGLMNQADESAWLKVGQLGRMIRFFQGSWG